MPDTSMYTLEAAVTEASIIALSIADSGATPTPTVGHIRLFKTGFTPNWNTVKADLVAVETGLGGYPAGGYDVEDMLGPTQVAGGGVVITTPTIDVQYSVAPGDEIGGGWLEDHAGKVRQVYVFDPSRPVQNPFDGFLLIRQMGYGRNA